MKHTKGIDVIVRFHDFDRIDELRRSFFSLVCQPFRPITVHIITQNFSLSQVNSLKNSLDSTWAIDRSVKVGFQNYNVAAGDARAALLNEGVRTSEHKYIAILDYDDVIYPEAFQLLIDDLVDSHAAISFGGILATDVELVGGAFHNVNKKIPWRGKNLVDLFRENHCPICSFVIDRSRISETDLRFDETLNKNEDYEFLLRVCSKYPSSFRLKEKIVGEYYLKNDGSNTVRTESGDNAGRKLQWEAAEAFIANQRKKLRLSKRILDQLNLSDLTVVTIADCVEMFGDL